MNTSNLILPAGDVRIGTKDFNIYANAQFPVVQEINSLPLKTVGNASVLVADVGKAEDAGALQTNIVRIDGQRSVYVPVLKQGGGSNTITIVNGIKTAIKHLVDIPDTLKTAVVFDQSVFVKQALKELVNEATIGLVLTGLMILLFLGSPRATVAVMLSVPLSAVVCLLIADLMGGSINTMILGGLALAFSRLIDNGVVVLENIFRYMELGETPRIAAEKGGTEVSLAVLAATVTTSIVFFPVASLSGVSKYLFTPLALGVVLSIFASYVFAMTVVPLFCATFIHLHQEGRAAQRSSHGFNSIVERFNVQFQRLLDWYENLAKRCMARPGFTAVVILACVAVVTAALFPFLGRAYFPRTDAGQFVINVKMPSGTRIEVSNRYIARGGRHHPPGYSQTRSQHDRLEHRHHAGSLVDLHQQLDDGHRLRPGQLEGRPQGGSYAYMDRVRDKLVARDARADHLLSGRRPGRRGDQSGASGADRYPDQLEQSRRSVRHGAEARRQSPANEECQRCLHSPGSALSRAWP